MANAPIRPDMYISADVETDGRILGTYSLLSFGLAVVGCYDGKQFERSSPRDLTFYREMRPISDEFEGLLRPRFTGHLGEQV